MKGLKTVLAVLGALTAIGAAIYVGITYGDKIVAWVKKILKLDVPAGEVCCEGECCEGECCEGECCTPVEEAPAETVEAEEKDFEG